MTPRIAPAQAKALVGRRVVARKRDGAVVAGKLVRVQGNRLYIEPEGKAVRVQGLLPLVLFDLAAIGTSPYAYGYPYDGYYGPGPAPYVPPYAPYPVPPYPFW